MALLSFVLLNNHLVERAHSSSSVLLLFVGNWVFVGEDLFVGLYYLVEHEAVVLRGVNLRVVVHKLHFS